LQNLSQPTNENDRTSTDNNSTRSQRKTHLMKLGRESQKLINSSIDSKDIMENT
jgi:hypothetical protein